MNALNFDILAEAVALHSNMHDIGNKVYITLQQISIIATSQPVLHMKYIPLLSDIPLRQRPYKSQPNMCISC